VGIAGAASGASRALEEIVAQRLLQQKLEQEISERQQRMAMEQSRIDEGKRQFDVEAGQRNRQLDAQDTDRRARSNQTGVRRMLGEALVQGDGPMQSQDRRGLAALQVEAGDAPTLLNEPKPERDPIADHEAKLRLEAKYRPAPKPERDPIADYEARLKLDQQYKTGQGTGPSPYAQERAQRTVQSVDELLGKVSRWNSGFGSLLAPIPETDARDFAAELDTLKANVAFNELTQMREASKTGGALGSVAVREMELLQSALGALDAGQSPANLKSQLQKVKDSIGRWENASGAVSAAPGAAPGGKRFTITKVGG
jgi:hypothetical protein